MLDDLRRLTEVDVRLAVHPAALHRLAQFWILKVRPRLFWGGKLDRHQHVVRVLGASVEPVPPDTMSPTHRLALVEDRLPDAEVTHLVLHHENGHAHSSRGLQTDRTILPKHAQR